MYKNEEKKDIQVIREKNQISKPILRYLRQVKLQSLAIMEMQAELKHHLGNAFENQCFQLMIKI